MRAGAVEQYERTVHPAYVTHARALDRAAGVADGVVGPVEAPLAPYPRVHGLVFGAFGESSGAVRALLRIVCDGIADARWREMGARSRAEALGFVTQAVRRRWGIAAVRAQAECRLSRRQYVGAARGARRQEGAPAAELDALTALLSKG